MTEQSIKELALEICHACQDNSCSVLMAKPEVVEDLLHKYFNKEERYRANFLWPFEDDSIEEAAYEFANGKTEGYVKEWYEELKKRISRNHK